MDQEPLSLGQQLQAAREAAGLTVEQVSARTRIRSGLLRDLEQGRTETSGGAVYVRGHLRAVAAATSSDAEPLLRAYEREAGVAAPSSPMAAVPVGGPRTGSLGLPMAAARERSGPRWGVALLGALGVLAALTTVGLLQREQPPAPDVLAGESSSGSTGGASIPAPTAGATPERVSPSAVAKVPARSGASLRVRVVKGTSWVNVQSASGEVLFRGVLSPGTAKDFDDPKRLAVTVGNAGAVNLICGGEDVPAGKPGQVRKYTCAAKGLVPA